MKQLQDIDLNLLVTFKLLYREQKLSTVADQMGLSQAAVSNALARLRRTFDDELFYRTARGMHPTEFAEKLAESILYALSSLEHSINFQYQFDAATSDRRFCIAMTDIGETYFLPPLMQHLAKVGPNIRLETRRSHDVELPRLMESGEVDLAVGLLPKLTTGFYQRRLFTLRYVCLMRRQHPLSQTPLTRPLVKNADHAIVISEGTGHSVIEQLLIRQGLPSPIRLRIPDFVSIPYILRESDLIATVPQKLAERSVEPFDLVYKDHPFDMPIIQINAFWHRRFHHDAANQWLRNLMAELFSEE